MEDKFKREEIEKVIISIFNVFSDEKQKKSERYKEELNSFAEKTRAKEWCLSNSFDMFGVIINDVLEFIESVPTNVCNNEDYVFIMMNSEFILGLFDNVFESFEGSIYCHDKSKARIQALLDFFRYGTEIKGFDSYDKSAYLNTHQEVMRFYRAVNSLYYGSPASYISCLHKMSKKHDEKKKEHEDGGQERND